MQETWTITKILAWCTEYFQSKGIESSRLDAELLLSHALQLSRMQLYLNFDRPLTEPELAAFKESVKRRSRHEPVAYILEKKEFWSREFIVKPGVLIPRPDTEVLVETVLAELKGPGFQNRETLQGFELGTGSGAIAITMLRELPSLRMTAVENSAAACEVTLENARKHGVADRLNLLKEDFFAHPADSQKENVYDFIVSNPPYVTEAEFPQLPVTIRDFEPREALVARDNGLEFYKALAASSPFRLASGGLFAVEIGENQGSAVAELLIQSGFRDVRLKQDYSHLDRVVLAKKPV